MSEEKKVTSAMTDAEMDKVTKSTAQQLKEQNQVKVKIFLSPEERKKLESSGKNIEWPFETVQINGHTYQIQRGIEVEVPQSVKDILEQAGLI